jgi:hypothetical protein
MGKGARITVAISVGVFVLLAVLILTRYGEYDPRDLPSRVIVTAKAMRGYHVHARVSFYPSVEIPGVCVKMLGTQGSSTIQEEYDGIPESGIVIETKKRWKGICGYQLNRIWVTCTESSTYPKYRNDSIGEAGIGILDKDSNNINRNEFGYHSLSKIKIESNHLKILVSNRKNYFFGCDTECDDSGDFGIDKTTSSLLITCEEGPK